jgi:hypothetical protein
MRRLLVLVWVGILGMAGYAQQGGSATLPVKPPAFTTNVNETDYPITHSDLYCAGFISRPSAVDRFVAGGPDMPDQSRFTQGDYIFLRGHDFQPGTRVSIVRQLHDPNRLHPFPGVHKQQEEAGQVYADIGYAVVLQQRPTNIAVARVEFACDEIVDGDQVMPFVAKQLPSYRIHSSLDRFPVEAAKVNGRIVAARDFDQYLGAGQKVYLNVGAKQGLAAGDYFRIMRGYQRDHMDIADAPMNSAPSYDDSQKIAPRLSSAQLGDLPHRVVGELIVISTQDTTATGMITFALEDVHLGDNVEMEPRPARQY